MKQNSNKIEKKRSIQQGNKIKIEYALVAQLDRAFGYEPKGRGFESLQARIKELSSEGFFIRIRTCLFLQNNGCILMSGLLGSIKLKCHPEFISGSYQNVVNTQY